MWKCLYGRPGIPTVKGGACFNSDMKTAVTKFQSHPTYDEVAWVSGILRDVRFSIEEETVAKISFLCERNVSDEQEKKEFAVRMGGILLD